MCTLYSKTAGKECGKAWLQADTNFWPKLSGSLSRWLQKPWHTFSSATSTPSTAAVDWEDNYKSFTNCLLSREYGESFLFKLANVLQVLPWGSVIVCHLRHQWREGNYQGGLPKRRGPCAGNEEHTCVYAMIISTRSPKRGLALTFSVICTSLQSKHVHLMNKNTPACALTMLTCTNMTPCYISHISTASAHCLPLPYSLHFLTQNLLISEAWHMGFIISTSPGKGLAWSLKKTCVWVTSRDRSVSLPGWKHRT